MAQEKRAYFLRHFFLTWLPYLLDVSHLQTSWTLLVDRAIKTSRVSGLGSPSITSSFSNFNFRRSYLECCINSISYLSGSSVKIKRVPFEVSMGPSVMGVLECSSLKMQLSKFSTSKARCTKSSGTSIFPESGNEHNSSSQSVTGKGRKTSVEPRG